MGHSGDPIYYEAPIVIEKILSVWIHHFFKSTSYTMLVDREAKDQHAVGEQGRVAAKNLLTRNFKRAVILRLKQGFQQCG